MGVVPEDWTTRLAAAIGAAVREYTSWRLRGKQVAAFDVGCFPWNGSVELSLLTAEELDSDPVLWEPSEVAAWHHYNFAVGLGSWDPAAALGRAMSDSYQAADECDRSVTVDTFLRACAAAVACPEVVAALDDLDRSSRFQIRVTHPDDGREFWPAREASQDRLR